MCEYEGSKQQFVNDANDEIDELIYKFESSEDVRVYRIDLDAGYTYAPNSTCTPDNLYTNHLKIKVHYRILKSRAVGVDYTMHRALESMIIKTLDKLESDTGIMVHSVDVPYNSSILRVYVNLWQDRDHFKRGE